VCCISPPGPWLKGRALSGKTTIYGAENGSANSQTSIARYRLDDGSSKVILASLVLCQNQLDSLSRSSVSIEHRFVTAWPIDSHT